MKESKLDKYRDFIWEKLQADISISQIRQDLATEGCKVSYSYLTEWIEKMLVGLGVEIPERKRGRPKKLKPTMFGILPSEDSPDQASIQIPLFLFALQVTPASVSRKIRDLALIHLELPWGANTHPDGWSERHPPPSRLPCWHPI